MKFIQIAPNLVWVSDMTELTWWSQQQSSLARSFDLHGRWRAP